MGSKSGDRITGTCLVDNIIAIGAGALTGTHVSGIAIAGSTNALRGQSWSGIRFYTAMTISLRPALPRYVSTAGIIYPRTTHSAHVHQYKFFFMGPGSCRGPEQRARFV